MFNIQLGPFLRQLPRLEPSQRFCLMAQVTAASFVLPATLRADWKAIVDVYLIQCTACAAPDV